MLVTRLESAFFSVKWLNKKPHHGLFERSPSAHQPKERTNLIDE